MSDNNSSNERRTKNWRELWLFDEKGVNFSSPIERADIMREYLSTGIMRKGVSFFSFPISFAELKEVRKGEVSGNSVHALAMALFDADTFQRITDPTVVLQAMELWRDKQTLPKGVSFFPFAIDSAGIHDAADKKATLKGSDIRSQLSEKFRKRV